MNPLFLIASIKKSFYSYFIKNSCRFNDDDSAALDVASAPAMDDAKKFSLSFWLKRNRLGSSQYIFSGGTDAENATNISIDGADRLNWFHVDATVVTDQMESTMVFRDTANWYHFFILYDSTVAAANRQRAWINGVEIITWNIENQAAENAECDYGGDLLNIGCTIVNTGYLDSYLAEYHFIDGIAKAVTDFGQFKNGVWTPKRYMGAYGSAGFYLDFANNSDFGSDQSGNGNDFTDVNLAANDQVPDTPTNNYCTLNSIHQFTTATISDGNLKGVGTAASDKGMRSTFHIPPTGKWYWEVTATNFESNTLTYIGIVSETDWVPLAYAPNGQGFNANVWGAYGDAWNNGDVIGVAYDTDNPEQVEFYLNNVSQGIVSNGSGRALKELRMNPYSHAQHSAAAGTHVYDFGQHGFTYTPPAGYKALCSKNLPNPNSAAKKPYLGFDILAYEGNAPSTQSVSGLVFSPDLVWAKNRELIQSHRLADTVRGATKQLASDSDIAEETQAQGLTAFNTDGFSVGTHNDWNNNEDDYVAWCWKESPVYGFDIVSYTGTGSVHAENHSLGGVPELMIVKDRDTIVGWPVYHHHALNKTDPETDYAVLNTSVAWADDATLWDDTAPTSTQFTVGSAITTNTKNFIAYLWRSIEGYSKVFSYEGNLNIDGPFVYCGFRPRFILLKWADGIASWAMHDAERNTYNPATKSVIANDTAIETSVNGIDILSNGFKLRTDHASWNSLSTFVGIAFAEMPFKYSNAR